MAQQKKRNKKRKKLVKQHSHQYRFSFVCFVRRFSLSFFFLFIFHLFVFSRFLSISSRDCSYPIEMFILEGKKTPNVTAERESDKLNEKQIFILTFFYCASSFVCIFSIACDIHIHASLTYYHNVQEMNVLAAMSIPLLKMCSPCFVFSLALTLRCSAAFILLLCDSVCSGYIIQASDENKFFRVVEYWKISTKTILHVKHDLVLF